MPPKAANTPRVKLNGNDASDVNEPIDDLIPQDHPREPLHLHDKLDQHAAIKQEVLTDAKVQLLETKPNNNYDEPEQANNKKSNKLESRFLMLKQLYLFMNLKSLFVFSSLTPVP